MRPIVAILTCLCLGAAPAHAADPLRLVLGFAPGGPTDQLARILAPALGESLGRSVVIDNRAGAGGTLAAAAVAHARPDGNTLLVATSSLVITAATGINLAYDPRRDLQPLYLLGQVQTMLVVRPSLGVSSIAELVGLGRGGRQLTYGSAGVGSTMHIGGELLNIATGLQITHVPYRGVPPAMADMFAGTIDMMNADVPVLQPFVLDRRVIPLVIYDTRRSTRLPDVLTATEVGMPQLDMSNWYALLAPAGTPAPVMAQLENAFAQVRESPAIAQRFVEAGVGAPMRTMAFRTKLTAEFDRWIPLLRNAGIRTE